MPDFALCAQGNLSRDEVYDRLVIRGDYVMETKHDGIRAMLIKDRTNVRLVTRNGQVLDLPHLSVAANRSSYSKLILDGELIFPGKSFRELQSAVTQQNYFIYFIAFDILDGPHNEGYIHQNYLLRHTMMFDICSRPFAGTQIQIVEQYTDPHTAMDRYDFSKEHNLDEGFVLKRMASIYTPGRSHDWLRSKFTNTISVMPLDVNDNMTVECAVWSGHEQEMVHLGAVQVPGDDLVLILNKNLNMVLEIEAYGIDQQWKLRHPVYKGCRFDVDMLSCTPDQLETLRSY